MLHSSRSEGQTDAMFDEEPMKRLQTWSRVSEEAGSRAVNHLGFMEGLGGDEGVDEGFSSRMGEEGEERGGTRRL